MKNIKNTSVVENKVPPKRRDFLKDGVKSLSVTAIGAMAGTKAFDTNAEESSIGQNLPSWSTSPGKPLRGYGQPSGYEEATKRVIGLTFPGTGGIRTPIEKLEGVITPNGLHFDRSHNGTPDIDPAGHSLYIHGMVTKSLKFSVNDLLKYPMITRQYFIECAGNSGGNIVSPKPVQATAGALHGLISCADWTGIPLSILLNEAGLSKEVTWMLAEGADAPSMSRSIPIRKALDDALIVLFQNGERLRPEQGYPVRLLLPGWEGNTNVKWLTSLKLSNSPTYTKDETSKYTDPLSNGKALQFTFEMGVKSVITRPSGMMKLDGPGLIQISGIAWSGAGRVSRVEVSFDGGKNWSDSSLEGENNSKSLVRFRHYWHWRGEPALIQSRATDEFGNIQPTREHYKLNAAIDARFHNNTIVTWSVDSDGSVRNSYA
jgi:sulfane dehydrogenase subunit SoxC